MKGAPECVKFRGHRVSEKAKQMCAKFRVPSAEILQGAVVQDENFRSLVCL